MSIGDMPDFEITDSRRDVPDGPPEAVDGDGPERTHPPYRRHSQALGLRRLAGAALSVAGILLLLVVFLSSPGAQTTLVRTLNLPVPADQLPLAPGVDVVYLERGAPWGTLSVDGVAWTLERTDQPYTGKEGVYTAIKLARGIHHISYAATPFPALACVISVPASNNDTCPLVIHPGPMDVVPVLKGTRILDLRATPERLTGSARTQFEAAINAALVSWTPSADVAPGESVLGPLGTVSATAVSLKASLNYTLVDGSPVSPATSASGATCASVCRLDAETYLDQAQAVLPVLVHVHAHWTYIDAQGHASAVDDTGTSGLTLDGVMTLFTQWHGSWKVTVPYFGLPNLTCDYTLAALDLLLKPTPSPQHIESTSGLNAADGCLVIEQDAAQGATTTRYFLYRFGVLMSANDAAHRALPNLPLVDAPARAVALQLGARLP